MKTRARTQRTNVNDQFRKGTHSGTTFIDFPIRFLFSFCFFDFMKFIFNAIRLFWKMFPIEL